MKILVTGKGGDAGSWVVRGEQLGKALGATVRPNAGGPDVRAADVTIVVKRTPESVLRAVRGARWVYDIVDAYPQPQASGWSRGEAVRWVQYKIRTLNPTAVIWPNQKMREDCDDGRPGLVLKHHHRPGIRNNPIREKVQVVGYEGAAHYLDGWRGAIDQECARRGWRLVINPAHLADLDIVLALRGGEWDGYVPQHWKSNVKLANAHASGTPFVGSQERGYIETATGAEYWAHDKSGLGVCFDWLESQSAREQIHDRFVQAAYTVDQAAADLKDWLRGL